jgi:hypothetical protein
LAGVIDLPVLHLTSANSTTELDPKKIAKIERSENDNNPDTQIKIKLADGQEMNGKLAEAVLPIRSGSRVLRVPITHFVSATIAPAEKPKDE